VFALFSRSRQNPIRPGSEFEPRRPGKVRTTARVVNVVNDLYGIPHVKFELAVSSPSGSKVPSESRTLSLERFADLYPVEV
jgi:hypothetical protein